MQGFETLTLCTSLNLSKIYTCFCLYLVKNRFPNAIRFQIDFITHFLLLRACRHVKFVYCPF